MKIYPASHLPGRKVLLNSGKEYLYFSGTDYLGMGHHEGFLAFLKEGDSMYGTHFGSSRNNSLRLEIYEKAETALANFSGAPAALTTSSGMWAGQLLMKELPQIISSDLQSKNSYFPNVCYHYAPRIHPALWGTDYTSTSLSWEDWAKDTVVNILESNPTIVHVICSDSVGSPFVESFDFSIFKSLPFYREIYLVVDDSHGFGVLGTNGTGIFRELSAIQQVKLLVSSSLNKALGIPGGAILGDHPIIEKIRKSPFFAGASPIAPSYIYAFKRLLETDAYVVAYHKLMENVEYFTLQLNKTNRFVSVQGYPVFCSMDSKLFDFLEEKGIFASCFSYPQPTDPPVTRLVISAAHQKEDLDRLAEVCMKY
jgi:8-amino-7-oxononanoate synthase